LTLVLATRTSWPEFQKPETSREACKFGCEGIVSKRLGSAYRRGRSPHWVKVKNPNAPAVTREAEEDWGLINFPAAVVIDFNQFIAAPTRLAIPVPSAGELFSMSFKELIPLSAPSSSFWPAHIPPNFGEGLTRGRIHTNLLQGSALLV
jgi:hypothetical protein